MNRFWWLLLLALISCNPVAEPKLDFLGDEVSEAGEHEQDVAFDDLPELQQTIPSSIVPNYDFLQEASFWQDVEDIIQIPRGKSCSNKESYAYFGIARLVYERIYEDMRLFPFGNMARYVPFFNAYPEDTQAHELYTTFGLQKKINEITRFTQKEFSIPLTLTSLTTFSGAKHDAHCRHRSGTVIDIRPFPASRPMTWRDAVYDRSMNLKFVLYMLARPDVSLIFFNDPDLLNNQEVLSLIEARMREGNPVVFRAVGGHDNHFHIEFSLDSEVRLVTNYVKSRIEFKD